MSATPSMITRCPECGEAADRRGVSKPAALWPKRLWIPALLTACSLVAFAAWLISDVRSVTTSSGMFTPRTLAGDWTWDRIQAMAAGEPPDQYEPGSLKVALADSSQSVLGTTMYTGSTALDIGFGPAPSRVTKSTTRGWPLTWMTASRIAEFENAAARQGFAPFETDTSLPALISPYQAPRDGLKIEPRPRWMWTGTSIVHAPPPEETGGVLITRRVNLFGLLLPVALAASLAAVVFGVLRLGALVRRRRITSRARRLAWLSAAGFALVTFAFNVTISRTQEGGSVRWHRVRQATMPPAPIYFVYENLVRLPFSRAELLSMPSTRSSDEQIAAATVTAIERIGVPEADHLLAVAGTREGYIAAADSRLYGQTFRLLSLARGPYVRRGDFGPPTEIPLARADVLLERASGLLTVRVPSDSSTDTLIVRIYLASVVAVILAACAIWAVARGMAAVALYERARRWRRQSRCSACGYKL